MSISASPLIKAVGVTTNTLDIVTATRLTDKIITSSLSIGISPAAITRILPGLSPEPDPCPFLKTLHSYSVHEFHQSGMCLANRPFQNLHNHRCVQSLSPLSEKAEDIYVLSGKANKFGRLRKIRNIRLGRTSHSFQQIKSNDQSFVTHISMDDQAVPFG